MPTAHTPVQPDRVQACVPSDEVAGHVGRGDAAAGAFVEPVDRALVVDVHCLHRHVQRQHAHHQRGQRDRRQQQHQPRQQQQEQSADGHLAAKPAVAQPAGTAGGQRTGGADQPEQADGGDGVAIGRAGQQKRQRRPEHAEAGKQQGAEQGAPTQHRLVAQQCQHRGDQARIRQRRAGPVGRQRAGQRHRHEQQRHGRHPVHGMPGADAGQHA